MLEAGARFPNGQLEDIDGRLIEFPQVFGAAPATVVFFYRGQW